MNPVSNNSAYCFGNLGEGLTFFSESFNDVVNSETKTLLESKLNEKYFSVTDISINDKLFTYFPLPNDFYFILLSTQDKKRTKEITHDLNNVFNNINNAATLLYKKLSDNYEKRLTEGISENLQRGAYLLKKLSANDEEDINLVDEINVILILRSIINELNNSSLNKITITTNFVEPLNNIVANEEEIFRALFNICLNAKESITGIGSIIVAAANDDANIKITISDTGTGIKEENLAKIFDMGFSTKIKKTESGIGLSIVKNIIEKYKGKIEVSSKVNFGTSFTITLPAVVKNITQPIKSNHIILADDDEFMLDLLTELFSSYNYNTETVKSGEELIEKVKNNNSYTLLIVDQNMPGIKGLDAIKQLREMGNTSSVILCSGTMLENRNDVLRKLNIADIVIKPYDFEYLLNKVKSLL